MCKGQISFIFSGQPVEDTRLIYMNKVQGSNPAFFQHYTERYRGTPVLSEGNKQDSIQINIEKNREPELEIQEKWKNVINYFQSYCKITYKPFFSFELSEASAVAFFTCYSKYMPFAFWQPGCHLVFVIEFPVPLMRDCHLVSTSQFTVFLPHVS